MDHEHELYPVVQRQIYITHSEAWTEICLLTTPYEYVSHVSDTGRLCITSGAIQRKVPTRDMCVVWE